MGCRRQRDRRLRHGPRLAAARPQPSRRDGRGRGANSPRHALWCVARAGDPLGRAGAAARAVRRAPTLHVVRYRGDDDGATTRPSLHRPREDRPPPRAFPRLERQRHRPARRRADDTHVARTPAWHPRRIDRHPAERHRNPRAHATRRIRRHRRDDPRTDGRPLGYRAHRYRVRAPRAGADGRTRHHPHLR